MLAAMARVAEPPLDGRVALVTGAASGLGRATAQHLVERGATVLACCRPGGGVELAERMFLVEVDLASRASIRQVAARILAAHARIDIIVHAAGVYTRRRRETVDRDELTFGVNYLARFLLTGLLLDAVIATRGRVILVSGATHRFGRVDAPDAGDVSGWRANSRAQLANVMYARELARRTRDTGLVVHSFHPGTMRTRITRELAWPIRLLSRIIGRDPRHAARALVLLATAPQPAGDSGTYFAGLRAARPAARALDPAAAARLWAASEEATVA